MTSGRPVSDLDTPKSNGQVVQLSSRSAEKLGPDQKRSVKGGCQSEIAREKRHLTRETRTLRSANPRVVPVDACRGQGS